MGFSQEFTGMIREHFAEDKEALEVLWSGDRRRMIILLLDRMALSPDSILTHLDAGAQEELRQTCENAKPVARLLDYLLNHEMLFGFSLMKKGNNTDETSEDDLIKAMDAPL